MKINLEHLDHKKKKKHKYNCIIKSVNSYNKIIQCFYMKMFNCSRNKTKIKFKKKKKLSAYRLSDTFVTICHKKAISVYLY